MRHTAITLGAIGALSILGLAPTAGASFLFTQVSSNGNTPVAQQFWLDVIDRGDLGAGVIGLNVSNTGPISSTIAEFHIEDGADLFSAYHGGSAEDSPAYGNSPGVDMGPPPPGNANLPDQPTPWTTDYFATANASPSVNGVDPNEQFQLRLVLAGGKTLQNVVDAFSSGQARAGIHVISIDDAGSETFVTNGRIPSPGAMGIAACALVTGTRRRHRAR